jgi:hypothetical protein
MELLDKQNPRATRHSVRLWGIGGGIVGGAVGLVGWYRSDMPDAAVFFIVPWMTVFCAVAGGAMEWQMPSGSDEDAEPAAAATAGACRLSQVIALAAPAAAELDRSGATRSCRCYCHALSWSDMTCGTARRILPGRASGVILRCEAPGTT